MIDDDDTSCNGRVCGSAGIYQYLAGHFDIHCPYDAYFIPKYISVSLCILPYSYGYALGLSRSACRVFYLFIRVRRFSMMLQQYGGGRRCRVVDGRCTVSISISVFLLLHFCMQAQHTDSSRSVPWLVHTYGHDVTKSTYRCTRVRQVTEVPTSTRYHMDRQMLYRRMCCRTR